ncbi:MAG: hypothetical protein IJC45_02435 [Clostridia bacterium]|nr:hypothetical protein [Clostridia bacterium]
MLKGVNRQVVEVSQTDSVYFEKILFFVKPEYYGLGEAKLREKANAAMQNAVKPPQVKKENRRKKNWMMVGSAAGGAAVSALIAVVLQWIV